MVEYLSQSEDGRRPNEEHRYTNLRPAKVFGLAAIAAGCAIALVGGAWSALDSATENERVADPPDLKRVVDEIAESSSELVARGKIRPLDREEGDARLRGKNAEDDSAVDDTI